MSKASPPTIFEHPQPIAIAHRGGAAEAPENTMAAFDNAARLGFRYIELDVQATRDGVLLAFHDADLERLTGLNGLVDEVSWQDLGSARVAGQEPIPPLEEVLAAWPTMRFIIELKSDRVVEPVADLIRRTNAFDRVCVGSFVDRRIARVRRILGRRLCTSIGRRGVARLRLSSLGLPVGRISAAAAQVPLRYRGLPVVDRRMVAAARRLGMQIQVWTVNDESEMERLIDLGVAGLITDRPSLLKSVLTRRGLWSA